MLVSDCNSNVSLIQMVPFQPGSFLIRNTTTHSDSHVLSMRVDAACKISLAHVSAQGFERCLCTNENTCIFGGDADCDRRPSCGGIIHYLIERTADGVRWRGLEKVWSSLTYLILHLTTMQEMLHCPLSILNGPPPNRIQSVVRIFPPHA